MSLTDKARDKAKKNPTWLLGVLVIVHLLVISFNRVPNQPSLRYVQVVMMSGLTPFQWVLSHSIGAVKGVWTRYFTLRDARDENERLKTERVERERQMAGLQEKARLFDQLNAIKDWQTVNQYQGVAARVISRDASQFFNTLVIDRGTLSGVQKDQPVIAAEGGLVGRVIVVSPISARVLLITDERHGTGAEVIAQIADSRLIGVVEGKSQALCEIRFFVAPDKIEGGEQVLTSGQDGIYPKGLVIGRVRTSGAVSGPLSVELEPVAPLAKLETVSVLAVPPERIRGAIEELNKQEQEKQDKTSDRKKRSVGR